jgi:hypothetical protein
LSLKKSARLRLIAALIFFVGIACASGFYWRNAAPPGRPIDDSLPGYARAQQRQMGILMGHTGVMMLEWQEALARPGTQAVLIAGVFALFALAFLRVATLSDEEEQERARQPPDLN